VTPTPDTLPRPDSRRVGSPAAVGPRSGACHGPAERQPSLQASAALRVSLRPSVAGCPRPAGRGSTAPRPTPERDPGARYHTGPAKELPMFETITFTRYTPTGDGPWFDARSPYVERVWTSALGCTCIAVLRAAATVLDAGVPVRIDGHELAGS